MNNLKHKCLASSSKFPKMKIHYISMEIHISMLLPKDLDQNSMISELNWRIVNFADEYNQISIISHHNLVDSSGKLNVNLGRHSSDG